MIDALVSGRLHGKPEGRTSKAGHPFATAKLRVSLRDGEAMFISVVAFNPATVAALVALDDGDSVALSGEFKAHGYLAKDGQPRAGLDLVAYAVLSEYHVSRKRKAVRGEGEAPAGVSAPVAHRVPAREPEFNDEF